MRRTSVNAGFCGGLCLKLFYHSEKEKLVSWMVVGLTTSKFNPPILPMQVHLDLG
jgi:hypothetical protein